MSKVKKEEIVCACIIIFILFGCICVDLFSVRLPEWMTMKVSDVEGLMNTLFSVQASVATISIALISLLTEMRKETLYGITLSKYFMDNRYKIFKYTYMIPASLALIIIEYFVISMNLINIAIGVFCISIILIIILSKNAYSIYQDGDDIKKEIENFIVENCTLNNLENIQRDIKISFENNDVRRQKESFYILKKIMEIRIEDSNWKKEIGLKYLEEIYSSVFNYIVSLESNVKNYFFLEELINVYSIVQDEQVINIWDEVSDSFYKSLRSINLERVLENDLIFIFKKLLYISMSFKIEKNNIKLLNCYSMDFFNTSIYYKIKKNNTSSSDIRQKISIDLYNINISLIERADLKLYSEEKNKILYKELIMYTIELIKNKEEYILDKTLFDDFNLFTCRDSAYDEYYISIIIYLYYLSCRETLTNEELRDFVRKIVCDNKYKIQNILEQVDLSKVNAEFVCKVINSLNSFELFPRDGSKWLIMDAVVKDFIIMLFMSNSYNDSMLLEKVKNIVKDDLFNYYNRFINEFDKYKELYLEFVNFLYSDDTAEYKKDDMYMVKSVIEKLYLEYELKKTKEDKITRTDESKVLTIFKEKLIKNASEISNKFNNSKISEQSQTEKFEYSFDYRKFKDIDLGEYYTNNINEMIILSVFKLLKSDIDIKIVNVKEREKLKILKKLSSKYNDKSDLVLGYKENFFGDSCEEWFREFLEARGKLKCRSLGNSIYALNTEQIYVSISDFDIRVIDYTKDEIIEMCEVKEDKYYYYIYSNLSIPFKLEEIIDYIHSNMKKIVITFKISVSLGDKYIGYGINITNNSKS